MDEKLDLKQRGREGSKPKKERKMHSRALFPLPPFLLLLLPQCTAAPLSTRVGPPDLFWLLPSLPSFLDGGIELQASPPPPIPSSLQKILCCNNTKYKTKCGRVGPLDPPRIVHSGPCLGATNLVGGRREGASQYQVPPPLSAFRAPLRSDSHNHQLGEHASHSLSLEVLRKSAFSHL